MTHYNNPVGLTTDISKFRYVSTEREEFPPWKTLKHANNIRYKFPTKKTKNFYLLQDYHGGRDGRVWLAAAEHGKQTNNPNISLVVIKFSRYGEDDKKILSSNAIEKGRLEVLTNESKHWKEIFNIKARVERVLDQPCIIMPFVFHCKLVKIDGEKVIRFVPPYTWDKSKYDILNLNDEVVEHALFDKLQYKKYVDDPIIAAKEALIKVLDANYIHNDIKWSHIGLRPHEVNKKWILTPIMIDLTDMTYAEMSEDEKEINLNTAVKELVDQLR
jgi:hypothetical protein